MRKRLWEEYIDILYKVTATFLVGLSGLTFLVAVLSLVFILLGIFGYSEGEIDQIGDSIGEWIGHIIE